MNIEQVVRGNIDRTVHLSLATVKDNAPWVCEVHFAYDEDLNLYFRSLLSRRHSQEITENSSVAGNIIDKYSLGDKIIGLYFEGTAKLLESKEEQKIAFKCMQDKLHARDDILEEAAREDGHKFYKITVKNWYVFGRFGDAPAQKYTLKWDGAGK